MALDNIATLVLAHIRDEEVGSNGASRIFARANNRKELLRCMSSGIDGTSAVGESRHRIPGASVDQPTEPCLALPQRRSPGRGSSGMPRAAKGRPCSGFPAPGRGRRSYRDLVSFASILRRALVLNGRTRPASTLVHCSDNRQGGDQPRLHLT